MNQTYSEAEHEAAAYKALEKQIIHITSQTHLHQLIDKYRNKHYTITAGLFILGADV